MEAADAHGFPISGSRAHNPHLWGWDRCRQGRASDEGMPMTMVCQYRVESIYNYTPKSIPKMEAEDS